MTVDAILKATLVWLAALGIPLAGLTCTAGCAQNVEPVTKQAPEQVTPAKTEQVTPTQGNTYYINVINGPGPNGSPQAPGTGGIFTGDGKTITTAKITSPSSTANGNQAGAVDATYAQGATTININTGGQAPNVTGTTSATGTQSATQSPTVSPTQTVSPVIEIPFQLALQGTQQAAQGGYGGTTGAQNQTNDQNLTATITSLRAAAEQLLGLTKAVGEMLAGLKGTTTQPATP